MKNSDLLDETLDALSYLKDIIVRERQWVSLKNGIKKRNF